jgi:uncharacterized protein (TIGR02453 family)
MSTHIQQSTLDFLVKVSQNNNREWFNANKPTYVEAYEDVKTFSSTLTERMSEHDNIEKLKQYRIYRDVRFSKNKTPYKNNLGGSMVRATKWLRGGYYFHFEPDNCFIAAGFWNPNSADLARIRQEIAANPDEFREIIRDKNFKEYFGELQGNQLKTSPRGYAKDHPAVDLLRYKQFIVIHKFTDKQVVSQNFVDEMVNVFKIIRPFFNYMSEVLTTDANGTPIED